MRRRAEPKPVSEETDLSRLLAAEAALERLLADARTEAARIVAEAVAVAAERERSLDKELQAAAGALQARLDAERDGREAELRAAAEADAARYEKISATRVTAVAQRVIARLLEAS
jgi:hypothetical protein